MTAESRFRTIPYSDAQALGLDWAELSRHRHTIHGLVEVDVTEARRAIHRHRKAAGRPLSFTSLLVACYAGAIAAQPEVQAVRRGRSKVVVFEDVDVTVLVEHELAGAHVPLPHIVREANRKTPFEIDAEIRAAVNEAAPYQGARRWLPLWLIVPSRIRRFVLARVLADPHRRRHYTGTAAVTAVSMFGRGTGWGVPYISHSICLTVGGIALRPGIAPDGSIAAREFVCLTLSVDHDVVNGAPLARFLARFRESIEKATVLGDETTAGPKAE
jgi:pyruvate/2-oxoglutarate dehydrogenase complex dihydrolipoamide acyltransferase (E2) component